MNLSEQAKELRGQLWRPPNLLSVEESKRWLTEVSRTNPEAGEVAEAETPPVAEELAGESADEDSESVAESAAEGVSGSGGEGVAESGGLLALDPGGTTGWAWFRAARRLQWASGQLVGSEVEQVIDVVNALRSRPGAVVVLERFVLRPGLNRGAASRKDLLAPERWRAMLEYAMEEARRRGAAWHPVVLQDPADAKTFATDARLRAWGMYVQGDHARDAVRHGLLRLARERKAVDAPTFEVVEGS